jgi:hypothetical protein
MGMALARVVGEVTLSLILLCFTVRSGLLTESVPGAVREMLGKARFGPVSDE